MGLFLYVLSVLSGHSGFLPCSKKLLNRYIGDSELPLSVSVNGVCVCVFTVFILLKTKLYYSRLWQFLKLLEPVV